MVLCTQVKSAIVVFYCTKAIDVGNSLSSVDIARMQEDKDRKGTAGYMLALILDVKLVMASVLRRKGQSTSLC